MKSLFVSLAIVVMASVLVTCTNITTSSQAPRDNTQLVNNFIGTGGHGHTFPGATVPYGMVQLSPDTRTMGWDACGGYHYSDSSILGFSHTHLSGTGIGDLGDVLFVPFAGEVELTPGQAEYPDSGYRSRFNHENEQAEPGYYFVELTDHEIGVELTTTTRAGFHRYTYNNADQPGLLIDLTHTIHGGRDHVQGLKILDQNTIAGYKNSGGWAHDQRVYFYAEFSQPFTSQLFDQDQLISDSEIDQSANAKAVLNFELDPGQQLLIKVGISPVDIEGAKNNLETEIANWNFELIREDAHQKWEEQLSKINVEGGSIDERTVFYTSLYHTSISPYIFTDTDGRYRGMDGNIHQSDGNPVYTIFSLWDTFRAFHPLLTVIDPERNEAFIRSLLDKYDHGGILPKWELAGNYTGTMIGYHAIPVIVDSYMKGYRNFDVQKAYQAMVESASYDTTGILFPNERVKEKLMPKGRLYNEKIGFIPSDLENESVSKALEYAYNDWCIAQMARELGHKEDYKHFMNRSKRYSEYFDPQTGFMRGKNQSGEWRTPFNPRFSRHRKDDFTEGNAFQWTWFVPHDMQGLTKLMGGKSQFIANLDTLFNTSSELVGEEASSDISGLIGQYAHGNEPSHHITHMYNFVDQPWKTQELTNEIMQELYFNDPNGLSGNEDCGQMSAWYLLNAMGFYSVCPGDPVYSIGRPVFDKVEINLSNGNTFTIIAGNNSRENKYIQSATLNGKNLNQPYFSHDDLIEGGTLNFKMGNEISTKSLITQKGKTSNSAGFFK